MSDDRDSAASSNRCRLECWHRRLVEIGVYQVIIGLNALFLLLLIGFVAMFYVVAINQHYETTGAFIDLMRLIAKLYSGLVFAALLIMVLFIYQLGGRAKAPRH